MAVKIRMVKFFACAHFGWSESVSYKRLEDIPSASIDLEQPWKIQSDLERPPGIAPPTTFARLRSKKTF